MVCKQSVKEPCTMQGGIIDIFLDLAARTRADLFI